MKAKIYIGILTAVLIPGFLVKAQVNDSRDFGNDEASTVVNNYYNYDFYYSSRINRFHRSFLTFNYYAPLFTDSYWYNYEPASWGLSIYGGTRLGLGLSFNYPLYNDFSWNYPYLGGSYYWGYDPFYYNRWYSPVVINLGIWSRWNRNYYSWQGHNRWDYDYRPVNNNFRDYRSNDYSSNYFTSRRIEPVKNSSPNNASRRIGSNYTQTEITRNNRYRSDNSGVGSINNGEAKRTVDPSNNQNSVISSRRINTSNNSGNVNQSVAHSIRTVQKSESPSTSVRRPNTASVNQPASGQVRSVSNSSSSAARQISSSAGKRAAAKSASKSSARRSSSKEKTKRE